MAQANNSQTLLKSIVIIQAITLFIYTGITIKNEGWTLFDIFIHNIRVCNWNGQFNLDFSCYLTLSGLWIIWRNKGSISSILLAVTAMIIGIIVFAPYLFYLLTKEKGDLKKVLLGKHLN